MYKPDEGRELWMYKNALRSLVAQVKTMPADEGDAGSIPGGGGVGREEAPLEKEVAIHSSILVWKSPWTEEPGGLQSIGSQECGIWLGDETATNCTLGSREIWLPEQLKWSFKICLVFFFFLSLYERQISIRFLWGQLYGSLCPRLENSGNYSFLSTWDMELTGWQLLRSDKNPWNSKCFFTDTS